MLINEVPHSKKKKKLMELVLGNLIPSNKYDKI